MPTLNWIGKSAVVEHHKQAPFHLLRGRAESSVGEMVNIANLFGMSKVESRGVRVKICFSL
jgi:hypothetical protein